MLNMLSNQLKEKLSLFSQRKPNADKFTVLEPIFFLPSIYYPNHLTSSEIIEWVEAYFTDEADIGDAILWLNSKKELMLSFKTSMFPKDKISHYKIDHLNYDIQSGQILDKNFFSIDSLEQLILLLISQSHHKYQQKNILKKLHSKILADTHLNNEIKYLLLKIFNLIAFKKDFSDQFFSILNSQQFNLNQSDIEEIKNFKMACLEDLIRFLSIVADKHSSLKKYVIWLNEIKVNKSNIESLESEEIKLHLIDKCYAEGIRQSLAVKAFNKFPNFLSYDIHNNFFTDLTRWCAEVRDGVRCHISDERLTEPVIASDGHSYQLSAFKNYISESSHKLLTSPVTHEEMPNRKFLSNIELKNILNFFELIKEDFTLSLDYCKTLYNEWLLLRHMLSYRVGANEDFMSHQIIPPYINNLKMNSRQIPNMGICVINGVRIQHPMVINGGEGSSTVGHTYDQSGIGQWLKARDTNPTTQKKVLDKTMIPNENLKRPLRVLQHLEWALPILIEFTLKLKEINESLIKEIAIKSKAIVPYYDTALLVPNVPSIGLLGVLFNRFDNDNRKSNKSTINLKK